VRKLISIGVVLALLVTFVVPLAVGAQDECDPEWEVGECPGLPEKTTKTMAGAAVWTMLGVSDIMGKAVSATTGQLACQLGGWSDELGIIATDVAAVGLPGLGDIIESVIESFLPDYADIGAAIADMLQGIADAIQVNQNG